MEKLKEKYQLFADLWKFYKKHSQSKPIDWGVVIDDGDDIYNKYNTEFALDMILAVINELEHPDETVDQFNARVNRIKQREIWNV